MRALAARLKPRLPLLLVLLGLALLLWSLRQVSLAETWAVLRRLTLGQLLLLALANGLVLLPLIGRWWVILVAQGYRLPLRALAGYRLAAFGVSYFTPGPHVGGEMIQVFMVEREQGVPRSDALAAVILDKAIEFSINLTFLLLGIAAILQWRIVPRETGQQAIGLAGALLLVPVAYLAATALGHYPATRLAQILARRWPRFAGTAVTIDESEAHRGHAGWREGGGTHFRVEMRSAAFDGMGRVARSRAVHRVLREELDGPIHALALDLSGSDG